MSDHFPQSSDPLIRSLRGYDMAQRLSTSQSPSQSPEESAARFFNEFQRLSAIEQRGIAKDRVSFSEFLRKLGLVYMAEQVRHMASSQWEKYWTGLTGFIDALREGAGNVQDALETLAEWFADIFG